MSSSRNRAIENWLSEMEASLLLVSIMVVMLGEAIGFGRLGKIASNCENDLLNSNMILSSNPSGFLVPFARSRSAYSPSRNGGGNISAKSSGISAEVEYTPMNPAVGDDGPDDTARIGCIMEKFVRQRRNTTQPP